MGILHSSPRLLGRKPEDEEEEGERPFHPVLRHQRQNHHNLYGDSSKSSERLPESLILGSSICNAIRGLLQKFGFVFCLIPWLRKRADPLLPVQNPASSEISSEPLLVQTTLISSPADDSAADSVPESGGPTRFAFLADLNADDQQLEFGNVDFLSCQQWPEENNSAYRKEKDYVAVSIPEIGCSLAPVSVSEEIEEIDSPNVPFVEESMGMNDSPNVPFVEESMGMKSMLEEEKVKIKSIVVVDEGRWFKHYNSRHRILLVGEGDFSFSACLAVAFGLATSMIATSLDSKAFLKKNYSNALSNIEELRSRGVRVMHGVNATKMTNHALLGQLKFDRIIFNFPFAGFFKKLSRESQLRRHRRLVSLFLKNAREMISENGEIHISHKINEFHIEWKLESLASSHKLRLVEAVHFNHLDYPGYNTKCGFGGDNNFNCNPSKTYKFGLKKRACY